MVLAKKKKKIATTKEKTTGLSKYTWELKNNSITNDLMRSIAFKVHLYTGCTRKCNLCLSEQLAIMKADPESLLKTCDQLICKYRHMNKFTLRCS